MNPFLSTSDTADALQQEARVWLRRLSGGQATQWDAQAFLRWRERSAAHRTAFAEARRQWQALQPAAGELLRSDPALQALLRPARQRPPARRRAFLGAMAGGAVAAAAAGIAVNYPPAQWNADYRTATGEQKSLRLGDSVQVVLNTQTSARRQDGGLELLEGEAAVDLAADLANGRQPFCIAAGSGRSLGAAGRFEVRYLDGRVRVACIDGTVRLEHPGGSRLLQARQQAVYDSASVSDVAAIDAAELSAWRHGELVFRQVPLEKVVREINRYRPGRVLLASQSQRQSAVSGRFAIAHLDAALLQIQRSFDLRASTLPGGLLILA
ncbi:DUF4880 domain-containing protein [Xylophilus rhododendri]|uniref:DUF4880 domain-containing protein n=1 Tax=Xylophilus rhododendri TaxID=2697032 RepID=A0A857J0K3_9BURK|nr:FecR domain-containing protein [Xylophilus rhododendri]QHI97394.1 DUF4880 domain-containing protein [Xylophilus rhododendri]